MRVLLGSALAIVQRVAIVLCLALAVVVATSPVAVAAEREPAAGAAQASPESEPGAYEAPSDHPHLSGPLPELPSPPASFNSYDGGWIRFAYPPPVRERVQPLIAAADELRAELSERLGQRVLDSVHVYVARTPGEMTTLAPEGAPYPKYAAGVAYSRLGLVLLTIAPPRPNAAHDLAEVFRHELAHVALHDAVSDADVDGSRAVPRWFNEGFAVHASGESQLARLQTLWTATLAGNLVPLARLDRAFPSDAVRADLAYAQSADVVRFLMRQQERERFPALIERIRAGQSFEGALLDAYGLDLMQLEHEWRADVAKRYSFWPVFFSGSLVWVGAIGLFALGWRKRRQRSRKTLERWSREEAVEDERRARLSERASAARIHIVLPSRDSPELPENLRPPSMPDGDVPKVEHDGRWHTLH